MLRDCLKRAAVLVKFEQHLPGVCSFELRPRRRIIIIFTQRAHESKCKVRRNEEAHLWRLALEWRSLDKRLQQMCDHGHVLQVPPARLFGSDSSATLTGASVCVIRDQAGERANECGIPRRGRCAQMTRRRRVVFVAANESEMGELVVCLRVVVVV